MRSKVTLTLAIEVDDRYANRIEAMLREVPAGFEDRIAGMVMTAYVVKEKDDEPSVQRASAETGRAGILSSLREGAQHGDAGKESRLGRSAGKDATGGSKRRGEKGGRLSRRKGSVN